jgi:hypothetical protein
MSRDVAGLIGDLEQVAGQQNVRVLAQVTEVIVARVVPYGVGVEAERAGNLLQVVALANDVGSHGIRRRSLRTSPGYGSDAMAAAERAGGRVETGTWVQLEPSNVQVSFAPSFPEATPPKSTTSLPTVAIAALHRPGGEFETETWVQLVPLNVQVSFA